MGLFKNNNRDLQRMISSHIQRATVRCPRCGTIMNIQVMGPNDTVPCRGCSYKLTLREKIE